MMEQRGEPVKSSDSGEVLTSDGPAGLGDPIPVACSAGSYAALAIWHASP